MLDLRSFLKYIAIIYGISVLLFLFTSCSSTPTIIEKPVVVTVPEFRDTTIVLRDTVIVNDSLWYSEVTDSLNNVIGNLKVYFNKKIAELKLNAKKDTVYIRDTVEVGGNTNPIVPIIVNSFAWWEQTILFSGFGLILALLIAMRVKRGKVI